MRHNFNYIDDIDIDYIDDAKSHYIYYIDIDDAKSHYINHSLLRAKGTVVLECKFINQPHQWRDRGHRIAR